MDNQHCHIRCKRLLTLVRLTANPDEQRRPSTTRSSVCALSETYKLCSKQILFNLKRSAAQVVSFCTITYLIQFPMIYKFSSENEEIVVQCERFFNNRACKFSNRNISNRLYHRRLLFLLATRFAREERSLCKL